jgi:FkbM family methyltransferase
MSINWLEAATLTARNAATARMAAELSYERLAGGDSSVLIFGCGHLGRSILPGAVRAGLNVLGFLDNNPVLWGSSVDGVPVFRPCDAIAQHGVDAVVVLGVYNSSIPRRQLVELGCQRVLSYRIFFWRFSSVLLEEDRLEPADFVLNAVDSVQEGYQCLSDDRSRQEFAAQVRWRWDAEWDALPEHESASQIYFHDGLVELSTSEELVDCGAFDGDSIRAFINRTDGSFRGIHALEPDAANRQKLYEYLEMVPRDISSRIKVLPFGAGDRNATLRFDSTGTAGSRIGTGDSATEIECRCLDDLFEDERPTIIKMDIEGAEPAALRGAQRLLRRARPTVAVCAYHKSEHLWTIPSLLKRLTQDYAIFLRRYAEDCWELVYYAIPLERVRDGGN